MCPGLMARGRRLAARVWIARGRRLAVRVWIVRGRAMPVRLGARLAVRRDLVWIVLRLRLTRRVLGVWNDRLSTWLWRLTVLGWVAGAAVAHITSAEAQGQHDHGGAGKDEVVRFTGHDREPSWAVVGVGVCLDSESRLIIPGIARWCHRCLTL